MEVIGRNWLHTCLHKLQLLFDNCKLHCVGLASIRIRRLLRHWQAVPVQLKIPVRISVLCNEADVCSSICCAREFLTYSSSRRRLHASLCLVGVCGRCVDSSSWSVSMCLAVVLAGPYAGLKSGKRQRVPWLDVL